MLYTLVIFAGIVSVAASSTADCHIYHPDEYGQCGYKVPASDLSVNCLYQGNTPPSKPCLTASKYNPGDCGTCYKVSFSEKGTIDKVDYTRTILIKAVDSTGAADFEIAQNGWTGPNGLCPVTCVGSGICALKASDCKHGANPNSEAMPSGCYSGYRGITFTKTACPGGTGGSSGGGGNTGGGSTGGGKGGGNKGGGSSGGNSGGGGGTGGNSGGSCKDEWNACSAYKSSCTNNPTVKRLCKKTCGTC